MNNESIGKEGCIMEKTGYIYALTNESFHRDNWIKIGYAEDVSKRVKDLSNTSVPLPYEVYCTYEIPRIQGIKDPDKLLHALITKLNPSLRISPNREFFEMLPWDAYDMLYAIAQMHGRTDKLTINKENSVTKDAGDDAEYSVEKLYPDGTDGGTLYKKIRGVLLGLDSQLEETPRQLYVAFKKNKRNVVSLWPRVGCLEVVLNAKLGQISDKNDLIYDISNRQWSSEQYAFKFYIDSDDEAVRDILEQVIMLKK